jgi:hypothetical protein
MYWPFFSRAVALILVALILGIHWQGFICCFFYLLLRCSPPAGAVVRSLSAAAEGEAREAGRGMNGRDLLMKRRILIAPRQ